MRYLSIFCIIFLLSCSQNIQHKDAITFSGEDFPETIYLTGKEVIFEDNLYMPIRIYLVDSTFVMLNANMEKHLFRFNIHTKEKIGEDIPFGSGPEEMISPQSVQLWDSIVWIYDAGKRKLMSYSRKDFSISSSLKSDSAITFEDPLDKVIVLNKKEVVATVLSPEHKRLSFYKNNRLVTTVGGFPPVSVELSPIESIETFLGDLSVNPQTKQICLSYRRTDLIEFYNSTGELEKRIHGPDHFFPYLKQRDSGEGVGFHSIPGETRDAYFFPVQTQNKIAFLYSGKAFDLDKKMYLLNQILLFDWNGTPLKRYILDIPIFHFTIDELNNKLYGITDYPEFRIIEFQL